MPIHVIKRIDFLGRRVPIVLQNENGPCPLLAICNALLLRGSLGLPDDLHSITTDQLVALAADYLMESNESMVNVPESVQSNQQQQLSDVMEMLPKMGRGLDVNVHFDRPDHFEFTRELAVFDMFDVSLYHGWIVDPADANHAPLVSTLSYNALVELAIDLPALEEQWRQHTAPQSSKVAADVDRMDVGEVQLEHRAGEDSTGGAPVDAEGVADASLRTAAGEAQNSAAQPVSAAEGREEGNAAGGSAEAQVRDVEGDGAAPTVAGLANPMDGERGVEEEEEEGNNEEEEEGIDHDEENEDEEEEDEDDGNGEDEDDNGVGEEEGFDQDEENEDEEEEDEDDGNGEDEDDNGEEEEEGAQAAGSDGGGMEEEGSSEGSDVPSSPGSAGVVVASPAVPVADSAQEEPHTQVTDEELAALRDKIDRARVAQQWLECCSSQLTQVGLQALYAAVQPRELAVFFRNNHFATMFHFEGRLYLLCADQGFAEVHDVVWECLDTIDGNTEMVNSEFQVPHRVAHARAQHLAQDEALAARLQQEETQLVAEHGRGGATHGARPRQREQGHRHREGARAGGRERRKSGGSGCVVV